MADRAVNRRAERGTEPALSGPGARWGRALGVIEREIGLAGHAGWLEPRTARLRRGRGPTRCHGELERRGVGRHARCLWGRVSSPGRLGPRYVGFELAREAWIRAGDQGAADQLCGILWA